MSCPSHSSEPDEDSILHGTDRRSTDRLEYDDFVSPPNGSNNIIPDVYEMAAAIGSTMEPILDEFGHDKLEPLTKEVVRCLEQFEKTVNILTKETERSLEFQYNVEKSQHECTVLKQKHEKEIERFDDTIMQLQATIDALQHSNDTLVENWEFESEQQKEESKKKTTATAAEINLARQLRESLERVHRLEKETAEYKDDIQILSDKVEKYQRLEEAQYLAKSKRKNSKDIQHKIQNVQAEGSTEEPPTAVTPSNSTPTTLTDDDTISIVELQKVLRDKNFYKEKCFAMEDQMMEYKMMLANYQLQQAGAVNKLKTSTNILSTSSRSPNTPKSNNNHSTATTNSNSAQSFLNMISPSKPSLRKLFSLANKQDNN